MAKRGRPPKTKAVAPSKDEEKGQLTLVFPTESQFRLLCSKVEASDRKMRNGMTETADHIKDATKNKNVHKGAFGFWKRVDKMKPNARSEFLFHWDQYRGWSDWDDEMDLFRKQATSEREDQKERRTRANSAAPPPEAA